MKKILSSFLILFFYLSPAQAVPVTDPLLFDFQGSAGAEFAPSIGTPFPSSSLGISIIGASAFIPPVTDPRPWLNGPVNDGGLGVCDFGNDCVAGNSADHALEDDETLTLIFSAMNPFELTRIYFLNSTNGVSFNTGVQFGFEVIEDINTMTEMSLGVNLFPLAHMFDFAMAPTLESGDAIRFYWGGDITNGGEPNPDLGQDYFVAGLVPIPAALPLFISGLFGFAFFSRRRAAAR